MQTSTYKNSVLAVVLVSYLMMLIDISIVITGLPEIGSTMGLNHVTLSWVQNSYLLCFAGFLLLSSRFGDIFGRKLMLLVGVFVFSVASLFIGLGESAGVIIVARAVQGVAASVIAPSVLTIITVTFPEGRQRNQIITRKQTADVGR